MRNCLPVIAILLLSVSAARADGSYEWFNQYRGNPQVQAYFSGLLEGVKWGNSWVAVRESRLSIYCAPGNLAITDDQAVDILDRYVANHHSSPNDYLGSLLMEALAETFSCSK